jgi:hypothetical protein
MSAGPPEKKEREKNPRIGLSEWQRGRAAREREVALLALARLRFALENSGLNRLFELILKSAFLLKVPIQTFFV